MLERFKQLALKQSVLAGVVIFLVFWTIFYSLFLKTPIGFVPETVVTVSSGESLGEVTTELNQNRIISSAFWLKAVVYLAGRQKKIIAGDYIFHRPENIFQIARRLIIGNFEMVAVKVTIPEGSSSYDIANIISKKFPEFDSVDFLKEAKLNEGYLFPDTYFLYATVNPDSLIKQMRDNFDVHVSSSTPSVIIMASILEEEAKTTHDRQVVSGILWKRIKDGMNLQIDTPFKYFLNKTSSELTMSDLQSNSPYNTYKYKGLPPTAITNPGLDAINAALNPETSPYYFFISDKQGNMHYAVTFAEHQANIAKYLR